LTSGRPSNAFARALRALRKALDAQKIPSAIIGGIAINANGIARFTEDVDATIPGADLDLTALIKRLGAHGIAPRHRDAMKFARRSQVLLLTHKASGVDLDVSLAWIGFELEAIRRARELTFGSARIRVARPEDLLIYKLIANRPQDLWDAERLLLLFRDKIDLDRVRRVLRELSEHLDGPDRSTILTHLSASLPTRRARRKGRG
jgi:hypothetical protein